MGRGRFHGDGRADDARRGERERGRITCVSQLHQSDADQSAGSGRQCGERHGERCGDESGRGGRACVADDQRAATGTAGSGGIHRGGQTVCGRGACGDGGLRGERERGGCARGSGCGGRDTDVLWDWLRGRDSGCAGRASGRGAGDAGQSVYNDDRQCGREGELCGDRAGRGGALSVQCCGSGGARGGDRSAGADDAERRGDRADAVPAGGRRERTGAAAQCDVHGGRWQRGDCVFRAGVGWRVRDHALYGDVPGRRGDSHGNGCGQSGGGQGIVERSHLYVLGGSGERGGRR